MQTPAPVHPQDDIARNDATTPPEKAISSTALLRGQSVVTIAHRGVNYRLQETRAGKLILTK